LTTGLAGGVRIGVIYFVAALCIVAALFLGLSLLKTTGKEVVLIIGYKICYALSTYLYIPVMGIS